MNLKGAAAAVMQGLKKNFQIIKDGPAGEGSSESDRSDGRDGDIGSGEVDSGGYGRDSSDDERIGGKLDGSDDRSGEGEGKLDGSDDHSGKAKGEGKFEGSSHSSRDGEDHELQDLLPINNDENERGEQSSPEEDFKRQDLLPINNDENERG